MENWKKIYEDQNPYRIEIVKDILEKHQLKPVLINKKDTAYHFGVQELYINRSELLKALKILKDEVNF